jgi:hypothetical protein
MAPLVQELLAYAVVAAAGAWLSWRWLRSRRSPACERCGPAPARHAPRGGVRPASLRVLR